MSWTRGGSERACIHASPYCTCLRCDPAPTRRTRTATLVHGEALDVLRALPDGCAGLVYVDPPFNTGGPRHGVRTTATLDADVDTARVRRPPLPDGADERRAFRRSLRRLHRMAATAARRNTPHPRAARQPLLPHRSSRVALLQGAARRDLRSRMLSQRGRVGVRLRRADEASVAREARRDPGVRPRPASLSLRRERGDARAVHGASPADTRASGARQAADGRLVAHDRADVVPRAHRAIPRRSRSASCAGSSPPRRGRASWWSTGAPGAAPRASPRPSSDGVSCSSTIRRTAIAVMRTRLAGVTGPRGRHVADAVALQEPLGDDDALNLVGPLADDQQRRVAIQPLHLVLLREPVAAVHAHRLADDLEARLGGEELRHPAFDVRALAGILLARREVREQTRRLDLRRHVGELELDRLVLGDRDAERMTLLCIRDGRARTRAGRRPHHVPQR